MKTKILNWLKWELAGEELHELQQMQCRATEVAIWLSHNKVSSKTADYILKPHTYPYQALGVHGSIEDFRRYIEKISKD
ncbi:hypothetical protein VPHF99_0166 [Vibrio phage F99]